MKASFRLLTQYCDTRLTPVALGERFRLTSSEVEEVVDWSKHLSNLVVGYVVESYPHPSSDHLHVVRVQTGPDDIRQIVCGAPNVRSNTSVIVALPGSSIHPVSGNPLQINETTIRGVTSSGMLCSYEEIGLAIPNPGIIILDTHLKPGATAATALELDDAVLDLEITPNRPDLLGILGLAREMSSFQHLSLRMPAIATLPKETLELHLPTALCPYYTGITLTDCKVAESPYWLQKTLLLHGMRPINNIVDVTNYVMLETGQPLHAFDKAQLAGNPSVRLAKSNETLRSLDGQLRSLTHEDIVIVNTKNQPIALAGIIGGTASAISEATQTIFLESAVFDGAHIRRSSRRQSLRTEASTRMEKGLNPAGAEFALARAIKLLEDMQAAISGPTLLKSGTLPVSKPITVSYAQIQSLLGITLSPMDCKRILLSLGFEAKPITKASITVTPPSWRSDVRLPEDVIEELLRIWGYQRIPSTLPSGVLMPPKQNRNYSRKNSIRHLLAASGLHETVSLSLTSKTSLEKSSIAESEAVSVLLPLSKEGEILLPEHLISFMQNVSLTNRTIENIELFEIGAVFSPGLKETVHLSFLLRSNGPVESLYQRGKGLLLLLAEHLKIGLILFESIDTGPTYFTKNTALSFLGGSMGQVSDSVLAAWKIRTAKSILYVSFDLESWLGCLEIPLRYQLPSAFPISERDITFLIPEAVEVGPILDAVASHQSKEMQSKLPELVTIYRAEAGTKAVTIHLYFGSRSRTLKESEIADNLQVIGNVLTGQFQVTLK